MLVRYYTTHYCYATRLSCAYNIISTNTTAANFTYLNKPHTQVSSRLIQDVEEKSPLQKSNGKSNGSGSNGQTGNVHFGDTIPVTAADSLNSAVCDGDIAEQGLIPAATTSTTTTTNTTAASSGNSGSAYEPVEALSTAAMRGDYSAAAFLDILSLAHTVVVETKKDGSGGNGHVQLLEL
jgi:hypothetical protein